MANRTQVTSHVQAPPPLAEGRPVVGRETLGVRVLIVRHGQCADQEEAWHAERAPGEMTSQAVVVALELRMIARLLFEAVEDDALTRVFCRHLYHGAAPNVTDGDGIVEEECARAPHIDERTLGAVLREQRHL